MYLCPYCKRRSIVINTSGEKFKYICPHCKAYVKPISMSKERYYRKKIKRLANENYKTVPIAFYHIYHPDYEHFITQASWINPVTEERLSCIGKSKADAYKLAKAIIDRELLY